MQEHSDDETPLEAAADQSPEVVIDEDGLARTQPPVAVYTASSAADGEIIRGLLESEGIPAVYEPMQGLTMTGSAIIGETMHGAVLVAVEDESRALELISAYSTPTTDSEIIDAEEAAGS